jgi:hypothetical protein
MAFKNWPVAFNPPEIGGACQRLGRTRHAFSMVLVAYWSRRRSAQVAGLELVTLRISIYGDASAARSRCCRRRAMEFGINSLKPLGQTASAQRPSGKPTTNSYKVLLYSRFWWVSQA